MQFFHVYNVIYLQKNIESVVSLQYGRKLIPFRVSVSWNEDQSAKPTMEYHVKIIGTDGPKNSITIKPPAGCTGAQQTVSCYYNFY